MDPTRHTVEPGYQEAIRALMDENEPRSAHVRFAVAEEYIPRPRRPYRYDSRAYDRRDSSRRSTNDDVIIYPRVDRRRDSRDRPGLGRTYLEEVEAPGTRYFGAQRNLVPEYPRDNWNRQGVFDRPQPEEAIRYTESPPPIEDEQKEDRPRRRSSGDYEIIRERRRERRSRSRSPDGSRWDERPGAADDVDYPGHSDYRESSYHQSYRPPSVASDDWDPYEKFDFNLPAQSITESSRDGDSDAESPDPEERTPQKEETVTGHMSYLKAIDVHASQYTGNAELGGTHNATLTVLHDPKGRRKSLFRWLHVRQDVMNFDDFWSEVSRLSGLADGEKTALARLRADVKKNCVRSRYNSKGAKVGYLEPRSVEVPLKSKDKKQPSKNSSSENARWICIPYFSLEQYSGLLAASSLASFPTQTLLQAQYSRNTLQRDMEQAVCQLGTAKRGECFHISQLWCIVVDNSLLVTCGTMPQSDLQRESVKVNDEPSREATMAGNQGTILVSFGESVVWSFTTEECQTWFAFISKFQTFWPQGLEFRHKDRVLTAEKWPRILRLAARPRTSVRLTVKTIPRPDPPLRAVLLGIPENETNTKAGNKGKPEHDDLHVLTLVPGHLKRASIDALKVQLQAAERFLLTETAFSNRKAYKCSKESTRSKTYNYLAELNVKVEENGKDIIRRAYEERIDIFNAADILYGVFLPKSFDDPTSRKFWGAIKEMVTLHELDPTYVRAYDHPVAEIRSTLRDFTQEIQAFQNIMSHADVEERANVELPKEFVNAWLYLVMAMIYSASNEGPWRNRIIRATTLVSQGMRKIIKGLSDVNLLEKATVLPLEVLSLLTLGLLQDQVGKSDDICETYSQYLNSLEMAITSKPSDRSYQHRIDLVQQEMIAVKRTLGSQRRIIASIRNSLTATETSEVIVQNLEEIAARKSKEKQLISWRDATPSRPQNYAYGHDPAPYAYAGDYQRSPFEPVTVRAANDYMGLDDDFVHDLATASKLSPTDAGGLRGLFFMECSRFIEQREFEFRRYSEYANDLERAISYKMDFTKDRQENAIFAFTLVTIIFLPLSAISSIFGMNTTDVRDMESGQWLYWVVALPVTVAVIIGGLWGMGELGNLTRWLAQKPRRSVGGYGAAGMMMPQGLEQTYLSPGGPPPPISMDVGMDYDPPAYATPVYRSRVERYPPPGWKRQARSVPGGHY
ncbi:Fc.00g066870.m01.CDS01 [Cosmosporella sp. VM-42]